jgi:hypothetical protein
VRSTDHLIEILYYKLIKPSHKSHDSGQKPGQWLKKMNARRVFGRKIARNLTAQKEKKLENNNK